MENIKLWDKTPMFDESIDQKEPTLIPYTVEGENKPAIIVCPGGAYCFKAYDNEGFAPAEWIQSIGINAFVLDYRVEPYRHPCPLMDLQRAIRYLRYHAKELGIDPNKVGVMGFSAGGHLAGSASVHFDECFCPVDDIDKEICRPDYSILCYPAVSADREFGHQHCFEILFGKESSQYDSYRYYCLEKNITPDVPPTFIWHTSQDDCVDVENVYVLASSLSKNKVPVELHVYPFGPHGAGTADGNKCIDDPYLNQWTKSCESWLKTVAKVF